MNQKDVNEVSKKLESGLGLAKYAIQQQLDSNGNWLKCNKENNEHTPSKS